MPKHSTAYQDNLAVPLYLLHTASSAVKHNEVFPLLFKYRSVEAHITYPGFVKFLIYTISSVYAARREFAPPPLY